MGRQHQKRRCPRSCHHTRSNLSGGAMSLPLARITNDGNVGRECPFLAVIPIKWHPAGTRALQTETSCSALDPASFQTSSYSLIWMNSKFSLVRFGSDLDSLEENLESACMMKSFRSCKVNPASENIRMLQLPFHSAPRNDALFTSTSRIHFHRLFCSP